MVNLTNAELTDVDLAWGEVMGNAQEAQRIYRHRFQNRCILNARTFTATVQRTLHAPTHDFGRARTPRVLQAEAKILNAIDETPSTSTRRIAVEVGVSQFVEPTLQEQGLHPYPYHPQHVQVLHPGDEIGRSTDQPSRTIYCNSPTRDYLFREAFFDRTEPELEESFLSKYYTPNEKRNEAASNEKSGMSHTSFLIPREGSQADNNSIEKVSKVLNLSNSNSCTYVSATECSNLMCYDEKCLPTASFKFDEAGHSNISQKGDDISELKASPNDVNKTFDKSQHLNCEIDTILISSDDDDNDTIRLSYISEESVVEDDIGICSNSEIYVISSDEDSSFEMQLEIKEEKIQTEKEDESQQQLNSASFHINSRPLDSLKLCIFNDSNTRNINKRRSRQKSGYINKDYLEMVNVSELTKDVIEEQLNEKSNVNPYVTVDLTETDVDNSVLDGDNANVAAKIIISNHDQYDEASDELNDSTSSEVKFNDTLEEMELALKYGLDCATAEELDNSASPERGTSCLESDKIHDKHSSGTDVHPQSYETINLISPCYGTNSQVKTPTKNLCSTSVLQKNSPSKVQVEKHVGFKVPLKSYSTTSNKTPDFKNVVSPVSVYIKNSPRVPKVQHVAARSLVGGSLFVTSTTIKTSNKENMDLPNRIYKPAKHTITSKEKVLKLPGNIEKHLPVIPDIGKHTRCVNKSANVISVEEQLLSEDLTVRYSNAHGMTSSETVGDISLLTTKKAYIT